MTGYRFTSRPADTTASDRTVKASTEDATETKCYARIRTATAKGLPIPKLSSLPSKPTERDDFGPVRSIVARSRGPARNGWTIKHLRDVGSNLAEENELPDLMISRFLGHTVKGVRKACLVKSRKPEYLVKLVDLVGAEYFDGEAVQVHETKAA